MHRGEHEVLVCVHVSLRYGRHSHMKGLLDIFMPALLCSTPDGRTACKILLKDGRGFRQRQAAPKAKKSKSNFLQALQEYLTKGAH